MTTDALQGVLPDRATSLPADPARLASGLHAGLSEPTWAAARRLHAAVLAWREEHGDADDPDLEELTPVEREVYEASIALADVLGTVR